MKRPLIFILAILMLPLPAFAVPEMEPLPVISAVLMEGSTGQVLYSQKPDEKLPPASVTKIMTLLIVMEAVESGKLDLEGKITCSETAASMGGSQIYLEENEVFTANELIKAVSIASANDAAVALAEEVAGSELGFVAKMNERARELGMENTTFKNCTGLDADGHLTTAMDIAKMSRELIRHDLIREYSAIWMDSVRNGEFGLTNTNRLIRTYKGATGLKTGFTNRAMFCLSATAERDGMALISVVMGANNSNVRFNSAKALLDYGFAHYTLINIEPEFEFYTIPVTKGLKKEVTAVVEGIEPILAERDSFKEVERRMELIESVEAPVAAGQKLGEFVVLTDGKELARYPVVASEAVGKLGFPEVFRRLLGNVVENNQHVD